MIALVGGKPRYGYRRLHVLLERTDHKCSAMRLFRLYQQAGLAVRRLKKKRLSRPEAPQPLHSRPNQEWALDFIADRLETGRCIRVLTIVDAFTRGVSGAGRRYEPRQPAGNKSARPDHRAKRDGIEHTLRQRPGTD